jgi:hypothetical protein
MCGIVPDADGCFLKIGFACRRDIDKGLGIEVDQREPAALELNHDTMALLKAVGNLVHVKSDLRGLTGRQGFGLIVAVAEFAAEDFGADEALIAGIAAGVGEDIDQLNDEVRVRAVEESQISGRRRPVTVMSPNSGSVLKERTSGRWAANR